MTIKGPNVPSEAEMARINHDFFMHFRPILARRAQKSPRTIEVDDLMSRVALRFDHAYRTDPDFQRHVAAHGIAAVEGHRYMRKWVKWEIADQWKRHTGIMPTMASPTQTVWLQLAATRQDGRLFPLVGDRLTQKQDSLLKRLRKARKVVPVLTGPGVGVWEIDPQIGPMTLRPSRVKEGGGDKDLEELVKLGFLEKTTTRDALLRWRSENNELVTLHLTQTGRQYLDGLSSGSLIGAIDPDMLDDGDDAIQGVGMVAIGLPAEDRLDNRRVQEWAKGKSLVDLLRAAVHLKIVEPWEGVFFWKRVGQDRGPSGSARRPTLEELADEYGISKSELQRLEKRIEKDLASPENSEKLRAYLDDTHPVK